MTYGSIKHEVKEKMHQLQLYLKINFVLGDSLKLLFIEWALICGQEGIKICTEVVSNTPVGKPFHSIQDEKEMKLKRGNKNSSS